MRDEKTTEEWKKQNPFVSAAKWLYGLGFVLVGTFFYCVQQSSRNGGNGFPLDWLVNPIIKFWTSHNGTQAANLSRFLVLLAADERRLLPFDDRTIDRHFEDVLARRQIVHLYTHQFFFVVDARKNPATITGFCK